MRKIILASLTALFVATSIVNVYAEETQTYCWVQEENVWKLKDAAGNIVVDAWYKDTDGSYYYLDSNGVMLDGILNDNGHYYFLQTALEGQGKMVTTDGVYNGVKLTFNQDINSPTYGEITSGVQQLIGTGIRMTNLTITTTRTVGTVNNNGGQQNATAGGTQEQVSNRQRFDPNNPFAGMLDDRPTENVKMGELDEQGKAALENYANNRY